MDPTLINFSQFYFYHEKEGGFFKELKNLNLIPKCLIPTVPISPIAYWLGSLFHLGITMSVVLFTSSVPHTVDFMMLA